MSIKKLLALALSITVALLVAPGGAPGGVPGGAPMQIAPVAQAAQAAQPQDAVNDPNLTVISPRNVNYVTDEVFVGSLERSAGFDARLNYPKTMSVLVPRDGMFVTMFIGSNEWVEEGDPVAVFSVVKNELEIDEAALALELAESAHRRDVESLENALGEAEARLEAVSALYDAEAEAAEEAAEEAGVGADDDADAEATADTGADADADAVAGADAGDEAGADDDAGDDPAKELRVALARAYLAVVAAEENLEFAIYNGERNLRFMRARLEDMRERSEDFTVYSPISGFVYDLVYFAVGRSVAAGSLICRISNPDVFQLVISAPNLAQLRLGAPVSIETSRRDAPKFMGHVIGNTTLLGRNEAESKAVVAFNNPQAFLDFGDGSILRLVGLRYRVLIEQADIQNVLLAPRRAISTESSYRFVNILEDGLSKKRYVLVGLTNIEYAQILDGLKPGDVLIMN